MEQTTLREYLATLPAAFFLIDPIDPQVRWSVAEVLRDWPDIYLDRSVVLIRPGGAAITIVYDAEHEEESLREDLLVWDSSQEGIWRGACENDLEEDDEELLTGTQAPCYYRAMATA